MKVINNLKDQEIIDYGVKSINAMSQWAETQGENINIAVLDTGIDYTHKDLIERVKGGANFTTTNILDYMDRNGHGTFCSGIISATKNGSGIIGVAPRANLYAVKVLNDEGKGNPLWIKDGILWSVNNGIQIISMSLGYDKDSPETYAAVKEAYKKGIIMVAATGNDPTQYFVDYPARYHEVIGVTAIDQYERVGGFCNRDNGCNIEIAAPGVDIISTYLSNTYAIASGTSFAGPHITGAIALLQAKAFKRYNRFLTLNEVKLLLEMNTKDLGVRGKDNQYGYGLFHF